MEVLKNVSGADQRRSTLRTILQQKSDVETSAWLEEMLEELCNVESDQELEVYFQTLGMAAQDSPHPEVFARTMKLLTPHLRRAMECPESACETPNVKASSVQAIARLLRGAGESIPPDLLVLTSRSMARWVLVAAGGLEEARATAPALVKACCSYLEALAGVDWDRFAAASASIAQPVASVVDTWPTRNDSSDLISLPREALGSEAKESLRLLPWLELLGLALLPFCGEQELLASFWGGEEGAGQLKMTREGGKESKLLEEACSRGKGGLGGAGKRAALRREFGPEALEGCCGGVGEGLLSRLASKCSSAAQAVVKLGQPGLISAGTAVLPILCAYTAENHNSTLCHGQVVAVAVQPLMSIIAEPIKSTAQAEGVKSALISLRECAEASCPPALSEFVPEGLGAVEGVPARLKTMLAQVKRKGSGAYGTARAFCQEVRAAAVECARSLVRRAGGKAITTCPRRFVSETVVLLASPLLLADGVKALVDASNSGEAVRGGEPGGMGEATVALREVVLPMAVEKITQALGNIDGYSTAAASDVLEAVTLLAVAGGSELYPYLNRLGESVMASVVGGAGGDRRLRRSFQVVRCLVQAGGGHRAGNGSNNGSGSGSGCSESVDTNPLQGGVLVLQKVQGFVRDAMDRACTVALEEWGAASGGGGDSVNRESVEEEGEYDDGVETAMEALLTIQSLMDAASGGIVDSSGISKSAGDREGVWGWEGLGQRLGALAEALGAQVVAVEAFGPDRLGEEEVALLCQGVELLDGWLQRGCWSTHMLDRAQGEGTTQWLCWEPPLTVKTQYSTVDEEMMPVLSR